MQTRKMQYLGLLSLGLMVGAPVVSNAAFSSISRSTHTAVANLSAVSGTVVFNAVIRNISGGATASQLAWSGVSLPYTTASGWKMSDQFIDLASTFTVAGGGIQVYTDNTATDAAPYNYSGTPTGGGLVDSTSHATVLPVAWRIQYSTRTAPAAAVPGDTINAPGGDFSWVYALDHGQANYLTTAGGNTTSGIGTVANDTCAAPGNPGNTCIQFAQASFGGSPSPNSVFFQANFGTALAGRTYGTQTLRLEAFTQ